MLLQLIFTQVHDTEVRSFLQTRPGTVIKEGRMKEVRKVNGRAVRGVRAAEVQQTLEEKNDWRQEQNNSNEVSREENSWIFGCGSRPSIS